MGLNINELDLLPALEAVDGGPELMSSCCRECSSSFMVVSHICD
ncbi:hypothetical protein [Amycolatopsis sp. NPDC058986]